MEPLQSSHNPVRAKHHRARPGRTMPLYTNTVRDGAKELISDIHCVEMACGHTISVALMGTGSGSSAAAA